MCTMHVYLTQSHTWKIVTIKIQMAIAVMMMTMMLTVMKDYSSDKDFN